MLDLILDSTNVREMLDLLDAGLYKCEGNSRSYCILEMLDHILISTNL
jgi:hypothetical protein